MLTSRLHVPDKIIAYPALKMLKTYYQFLSGSYMNTIICQSCNVLFSVCALLTVLTVAHFQIIPKNVLF